MKIRWLHQTGHNLERCISSQNVTEGAYRPASNHGLCCRCHLLSFGFRGFLAPPVFSPPCLPNRPSINPVTTRKTTLDGSSISLALKQHSFRVRQIAQRAAPHPKRTNFFFSLIETVNPGTKKISCIFGSRGQIKGNLDNSPNKPDHWTVKN
jgi:hypothetical protein